jgi:hypothetical protein
MSQAIADAEAKMTETSELMASLDLDDHSVSDPSVPSTLPTALIADVVTMSPLGLSSTSG